MSERRRESRIIDFRPAPAGWRSLYLPDEVGQPLAYMEDLPGWLIREWVRQAPYDSSADDETLLPGDRERDVVAATTDCGVLTEASDSANFWIVLGPTEPLPDQDAIDAELRSRAAIAAMRTARGKP